MNLVEKVLDGVQNLMNVNSATFSGAVDILVVPQEDGSYACTSWHVRFGKLQLLNTSEKKIHVKVNDKEIKGMRMRVGRAGEAYFVSETSSKPPPEFQASIDPEHGLSDEETFDMEPRAAHDDWAVQDDKHAHVVDLELDPAIEGDWGQAPFFPTDDAAHSRQQSNDSLRGSDPVPKKGLHNSNPSHALPSPVDTTSPPSTGTSPSIGSTAVSSKPSDQKRSATTANDQSAPLSVPTSPELSNRDRIKITEPSNTTTSPPSHEAPKNHQHLSASTSAAKSSGKSWGLSLFGFLGKKDPGEGEEGAADGKEKSISAALPVAASNRRTSLDTGDSQLKLDGDEIYIEPERSDPKIIQSSSLPSNWGPSPLLIHGTSSSSVKSNEEGYASDNGTKALGLVADERSRAAEDGSGVIYVGQKRKPRSSSITSSSLGVANSTSPTPSTGTLDTSTGTISFSSSKPTSQTSNANSAAISFGSTGKSPEASAEGSEKLSKSFEKSQRSVGSAVDSSPDSDSEYQDMVFEMDEEAYQAANPMLALGNANDHLDASRASSSRRTIEMSKCGMNSVSNAMSNPTQALEAFNSNKISWQALNDDPNLLFSPDIVFRIGGLYYPLVVAAPMLFSVALFNSPLSAPSIEKLLLQSKPKSSKWTRWFGWSKQDGNATPSETKREKAHASPGPRASASATSVHDSKDMRPAVATSSRSVDGNESSDEASYVNAAGVVSPRLQRARAGSKIVKTTITGVNGGVGAGNEGDLKEAGSVSPTTFGSSTASATSPTGGQVYYIRALKPSSDNLKALGLKPGANRVVFSVNSRLQGMQEVSSTIFLWDRDCKIVISDIDGTITKSDVLGQLFPVFGKDWSHSGVAALFQNIKANGYDILYLTARAIGAASFTKGFLASLQQDSVHLPDGPVFMSPDRLLHSLNREVILRRPEEFKIQCLTEIQSLFVGASKTGSNPFYAGFGNRETDALSYVAVGIPVGKTFTINPSGEITGHSKSIQRTYTKIHELAEQMFPPYHKKKTSQRKPSEQWNDFQFWETRPSGYSLEELEKELLK